MDRFSRQRFSVDLKARIGEIAVMPGAGHFGLYIYGEHAGKISKRELAILDGSGDMVSRWNFPDEVFALGFTGRGELAALHSNLDRKPHTLDISGFDLNGRQTWKYSYPGSENFLYFDVELDDPPWLLVDSSDTVRCFHGEDEKWNINFKRSRARSVAGVLARNPMNLKGVWNLFMLQDGGAMVLTAKALLRIKKDGSVQWEKKQDAPYKMLSADDNHILISSDGYYAKKPEQTVLLTGEGEELWRRQLPLPLATMGWSPFDGIAALGLYLEHDDGGLTFVNAGGNDIATQDVHGWPRGITFSQDLVLLACDNGIYAFNGRGEMLSHRLVDELESFCASPDGRVMVIGAKETLNCWER